MSTDNGKYFFIPDWLLQESSQTIHAYIYILNEINNNGGEFVTTKNEIAKSLKITYKQTRIVLDKILKTGQLNGRVRADQKTVLTIDFIGVLEDFKNNKGRVRAELEQGNNNEEPIKKLTNYFNFRKSLINYGFNESLVDDWLKVRKTKKATNTQTAFKAFITEIESRECNINEMLQTSVTNSWSGFKHKWVDNLKNTHLSAKPQEEKIGRTLIETIKKNAEYNGQY